MKCNEFNIHQAVFKEAVYTELPLEQLILHKQRGIGPQLTHFIAMQAFKDIDGDFKLRVYRNRAELHFSDRIINLIDSNPDSCNSLVDQVKNFCYEKPSPRSPPAAPMPTAPKSSSLQQAIIDAKANLKKTANGSKLTTEIGPSQITSINSAQPEIVSAKSKLKNVPEQQKPAIAQCSFDPEFHNVRDNLKKVEPRQLQAKSNPIETQIKQAITDLKKTPQRTSQKAPNPTEARLKQAITDLKKTPQKTSQKAPNPTETQLKQAIADLKKTPQKTSQKAPNPTEVLLKQAIADLKETPQKTSQKAPNPTETQLNQAITDLKKTPKRTSQKAPNPTKALLKQAIADLKEIPQRTSQKTPHATDAQLQQTKLGLRKIPQRSVQETPNPIDPQLLQRRELSDLELENRIQKLRADIGELERRPATLLQAATSAIAKRPSLIERQVNQRPLLDLKNELKLLEDEKRLRVVRDNQQKFNKFKLDAPGNDYFARFKPAKKLSNPPRPLRMMEPSAAPVSPIPKTPINPKLVRWVGKVLK